MKNNNFEDAVMAFLRSTAVSIEDGNHHGKLTLTRDTKAADRLVRLVVLGRKIAQSQSTLFKRKQLKSGDSLISESALGTQLFDTLCSVDFDELRDQFPKHVFNPILARMIALIDERQLIDKVRSPKWRMYVDASRELVDELNAFVHDYRSEMNGKAFKTKMKNYLRRSRKNEKELRKLIDAVFLAFAKVMVIRIDLSYKEHHEEVPGLQTSIGLADVKMHREKLLKKLKIMFKESLITYAWKLEYGLKKGYHQHCFFFLDGSKLRQDVVVGKMIGDTWEDYVTEGAGTYYNCNGKKQNYKNVCVGVFTYRDTEVIRMLKDVVATYMAKVDYFMQFDSEKGSRAFGKGAIPKSNPTGVGRPRAVAPSVVPNSRF